MAEVLSPGINLMCQILLSSHGRPFASCKVDEGGAKSWGKKWKERKKGKLWLVGKIHLKF